MPDLAAVPWRVGTKQGRTIYAVIDGRENPDPEGCDDTSKLTDVLIGVMDTAELAEEAVSAHNYTIGLGL